MVQIISYVTFTLAQIEILLPNYLSVSRGKSIIPEHQDQQDQDQQDQDLS